MLLDPQNGLTLGILVVAALVDSINPCVFGVLIFLLAFMTRVFQSPRRMLVGASIYISVVYLTYLALGLGFIELTVSFGLSVGVYWVAAIIAIVSGLIEMKEFWWYGKGFTLQMFPGAAERVKMYTKYMGEAQKKHILLSYLIAGLLGFFVVLVELPCTGAPYLVVLALIGKGNYAQGLPLLLLYNFIFILPLFFIVGVTYFGKSSRILERWRKEHRGLMRLVTGIFLIALGLYMISTVW